MDMGRSSSTSLVSHLLLAVSGSCVSDRSWTLVIKTICGGNRFPHFYEYSVVSDYQEVVEYGYSIDEERYYPRFLK